jgi:two-component sensor histidine kinase
MQADKLARPSHRPPEPVEALSAAFLESVLNASRDCIKVLSLDGELVFMNSGGLATMEVDDFERVRGCAWPSFWENVHTDAALEALALAKAGFSGHFIGQADTLKGTPKWWDVTVSPILGHDGAPSHILSISHDITAARELEIQRELLGGELSHRIKNVLAVVGAIANQSFRGGDSDQLDTFGARLSALGEAQSILIEGALTSASITEVVARTIKPHAPRDRCIVTGPSYQLEAKRALALALAVHELATNATKYGAFSNSGGKVHIDWTIDAGTLCWTWRESGGPIVETPGKAGFGSRIITRNLAGEFRGQVDLQHKPSGVVLTLTAPA